MRGSIVRYMYYQVSNELLNQGLISCIPDYKTMHNKSSWGVIVKRYNDSFAYIGINTSFFNPDFQHSWTSFKWFSLVETICHEFAHIQEWEHGAKHTKLTFDYILIAYDLLLKDEKLNKFDSFVDSLEEFKNSEEFKAFFDILLKPTEKNVNETVNKFYNFNSYLMSSFCFVIFAWGIFYFSIIRPPPVLLFLKFQHIKNVL